MSIYFLRILFVFLSILFVGCVKNHDLKFNEDEYNHKVYDTNGFDKQGKHINGSIYDNNGYDVNGYDIKGFNHKGLTKKEVLQQRYNYLVLEKSNISQKFNTSLFETRKDKYETQKEYNKRLTKKDIDTSFILSSNSIKGSYDPETSDYIFKISIKKPNLRWAYQYKNSKLDKKVMIIKPNQNLNMGTQYAFQETVFGSVETYNGSNSFGYSVEVTSFNKKINVIFPTNLEKITSSNKYFIINNTYSSYPYINIRFKVTKEIAKKYDRRNFKFKIRGEFTDIRNSLFEGTYFKDATIDDPRTYNYKYNISKAIINDFIIYDTISNEIVFGHSLDDK